MSKKVLLVLAEGFEEIEAVTPIDVLRRAELDVTVCGMSGKRVLGAHGLMVEADATLDSYTDTPEAIILPGGMPGSRNLAGSAKLAEVIKRVNDSKKLVAAICAAPALVLTKTGVLKGKKATCYPGFETNFNDEITFSQDRVVTDGNVITSRGPGTALEFALELVAQLAGAEKANTLREGLLVRS